MRFFFKCLSFVIFFVLLGNYSFAQVIPTWANAFNIGAGGSPSSVNIQGMAVDASGNTYATGQFFANGGSIDFDPTSSFSNLSTGSSGYNLFMVKYNSSGQVLWAFSIPTNSPSGVRSISLDASGNAYLTGYFSSQGTAVDFDPSASTANLTGIGGQDVFVAKYNSSGQYQWAINVGLVGSGNEGTDIKADASGNVYVTGYFSGNNVDFDPSGSTAYLSSNGSNDAFVAKYNSSGQYQWAFSIGGVAGSDYGNAISLDASSNVYVTGSFKGSNVDFDPSTNTNALSSNGIDDIFIAKYNTNGQYQWANAIGGSNSDLGYGITVDANNNIYVTGQFLGSNVDFDPSSSTHSLNSNTANHMFVAKYDGSGNYLWAFNAGGSSTSTQGSKLYLDANNYLYVAGTFSGSNIDFDPSAATRNLSSKGGFDLFFAKYSSLDGAYQWAFSLGAVNNDYVTGIGADASGYVYVAGIFQFDPSYILETDPTGSTNHYLYFKGGINDMVIAKYLDYNKWLGGTTNWATTSNWSLAAVPTSTNNVLIPATANNPIIGSGTSASVGAMAIQAGAEVNITGSGTLTAANAIIVNPGGALLGNSSNVSGTVTLQQSLIAQRGWRIFSNPFSTAQTITSLASNNGITINTTPQVSGLTDMRTFSNNTNAWSNVTGSTIAANTPYALFVRGLSTEVTGANYAGGPSSLIYNVSGTLNSSSTSVTPNSTSNFIVVGNPYAAPVKTSALTNGTGVSYYVYNIVQGGTQTQQRIKAGNWSAVLSSSASSTVPVLGAIAYKPSSTSSYSISQTADLSTSGSQQGNLFREQGTIPHLELLVEQEGMLMDKLFVRLDANAASTGKDKNDLEKFYNDNLNLYTKSIDNKYLAIDARNTLDSIPVGISALTGNYVFKLANNSLPTGSIVYLRDNYLNTITELKEGSSYAFVINADAASKGENRFVLNFMKTSQAIITASSSFSVKVLGNMVNGSTVAVQISGNDGQKVTGQLFDGLGRRLTSINNIGNGLNMLDIGTHPKGVYLLQLSSGKNSVTQKIIIE